MNILVLVYGQDGLELCSGDPANDDEPIAVVVMGEPVEALAA